MILRSSHKIGMIPTGPDKVEKPLGTMILLFFHGTMIGSESW
jgi:hypothetical protein